MGRATGKNNKELGALRLMQGLVGTLGSAGRGLAAGTAGLPGDIESLIRMLVPGVSNDSLLPTTERVSEALPQMPKSMQQPVAEGLGQMGAMTPGQVAKLGKAVGRGGLSMLERGLSPPRAVAQAGAVKPKGGNWLQQDGLEHIKGLGQYADPADIAGMQRMLQNADNLTPELQANLAQQLQELTARVPLNNWVRGPMTNYIRNHLGTAEDPLLKLAAEGISPMEQGQLLDPPRWVTQKAQQNRKAGGFDPFGKLDSGGHAKGWETWADGMVTPSKAGDVRANMGSWLEHFTANEPGFEKVPNESMVYQFSGDEAPWHLGFNDTVEALRKSLDPASNLPPGLRLTPEKLQQMGMEKAVRHQHGVREFEKAQEDARKLALRKEAAGHGVPLKSYESGHEWRDLAMPEKGSVDTTKVMQNPDGTWSPIDAMGNKLQRISVMRQGADDIVERTPEEAYLGGMLGHEGMAMDHCVGGYCNDVASGNTRILSLRGKDGDSHVTMDISPGIPEDIAARAKEIAKEAGQLSTTSPTDDVAADFYQRHKEVLAHPGFANAMAQAENGAGSAEEYLNWLAELLDAHQGAKPMVNQIHGKSNSAPKAEYLPMIQDVIRSNNMEVHPDMLEHAGLHKVGGSYYTLPELEAAAADASHPDMPRAYDYLENQKVRGYAKGGLVENDDDFAYPGFF